MFKYRLSLVVIIVVLHISLLLRNVCATDGINTKGTNMDAEIKQETKQEVNQTTKLSSIDGQVPRTARVLISSNDDEYVARNQKQCFESRNLLACIKYKAARFVWRLATNAHGYFPNEHSRELRDDQRRIRFIQLGEPSKMVVFSDARSNADDSELIKIFKFTKRATETFGRNHGVQLTLSGDTGIRVSNADVESRGIKEKKKLKWAVILPIIILIKLAHLKTTLVTLLLGVLGLNVLLIGGMGWLIHYLKFKTLCKIHPQVVQSHSHAYDSDPAEYSQFVGSGFPGSYYGGAHVGSHEANVGPYSSNWGSSKAYNGYNYLDTISKRLK